MPVLSLLLASSLLTAIPADWSVLDEVVDGERVCSLAQSYADGTEVNFMVTAETWKTGRFAFFASNPDWSISEGQELGDIMLQAPDYQFGAGAITENHMFYFYNPSFGLRPFLKSAASGGFRIIRNGNRIIGEYKAMDLAAKAPAFERCLAAHFAGADPFAD